MGRRWLRCPGVTAEAIDRAAREVIAEAATASSSSIGPGTVFKAVHARPYLMAGNDLVLEEGDVLFHRAGYLCAGPVGMRLEDIVTVTSSGADVLTRQQRSL